MEVAFTPDSVADAIANSRKSLETRDAVIKYFQGKYPGQKTLKNGSVRYEWKEKLVDAELALNPSAKRASLARRYQKDTRTGKMRYEATQPSKAQQQQYKDLSSMLRKEYRVHGSLCLSWSEGSCESRTIDKIIPGIDTRDPMQAIYDAYDLNGGKPCTEEDRENPKRPGKIIKGCKPSLFVTANWA